MYRLRPLDFGMTAIVRMLALLHGSASAHEGKMLSGNALQTGIFTAADFINLLHFNRLKVKNFLDAANRRLRKGRTD